RAASSASSALTGPLHPAPLLPSLDRVHLVSGLDRFEDGVEIECVAELHELLAQVRDVDATRHIDDHLHGEHGRAGVGRGVAAGRDFRDIDAARGDRKSTRLNSSHVAISYAVFCLKKKNMNESSS